MKYVTLDIGNVLVHVNLNNWINSLSKTLNIEIREIKYFLEKSQKFQDLGLTNLKEGLTDYFNIKSPIIIDNFINEWNWSINQADDVLNMVEKLYKTQGLQVALLSNIGFDHVERINESFNHLSFFNDAVKFFSCYVGARKPNLIYYSTFLQLYPDWKGCPYIDDLSENLKIGKQFGFKTYQFALDTSYIKEKYERNLEDLEKFILNQ